MVSIILYYLPMKQLLQEMIFLIPIIDIFGVTKILTSSRVGVYGQVLHDFILCLIGLHIMLRRQGGEDYQNFLENNLNNLFDEVPLQVKQNMWYMHDGILAHQSLIVCQWLHQHFPRRQIDSTICLATMFSDLNPCDYFWSDLKGLVYSTPVDNLENIDSTHNKF